MKNFILITFLTILSVSGYGQKNSEDRRQDSITFVIDQTVEQINEEKMDTLSISELIVFFDTLSIKYSPVKGLRNSDSNTARIFYNEKGLRKLLIDNTYYFFEQQKLLMTYTLCEEKYAHMGLCNGLFSEFSNYFIDNKFYKTIEGTGAGQCHCKDNIILDSNSINTIIEIYNRKK